MAGVNLNRSESGFCLEINQRQQKQFEQGHIIGVGQNQEDHSFHVGLIRWITEISCDQILVGIEKIAVNPFAIKCHLNGMSQNEALSLLFQGKKFAC